MEKYKYRAVNDSGRPIRGVLTAANETDLYNQLQNSNLELIQCSPVKSKSGNFSLRSPVKIRDMIQFFMHMQQMQGAGIPLLDALADLRDTADKDAFRDILSEIYRDVSEGSALSEAMANHPRVFGNLEVSLIASSEESGNLQEACGQLVKYLKWLDDMQSRVRKATRYPMILLAVVILTVVLMMGRVVPQIVGFLENLNQDLPFMTTSLIATSEFFSAHWVILLILPVVITIGIIFLSRTSESFAYRIDAIALKTPVMGSLIRKINISRFSQTFGALFAGGIEVLKALDAATDTVGNRVLKEGLENVKVYVKQGDPLSEALNKSGEFPSMVVRMVRVGEESGGLTAVLDQVSEFYTNDVDEEVQKVITMIEPSLTVVLGAMILWIAAGVFGPIYSSIGDITSY